MRIRNFTSVVIITFIFWNIPAVYGQDAARNEINFDSGWRFFQGDPGQAENPGFDDRSWRLLDLPHDWSVEGSVDQKAPAG